MTSTVKVSQRAKGHILCEAPALKTFSLTNRASTFANIKLDMLSVFGFIPKRSSRV